ncbi:uncharacterized protein DSM5745_09490 [Aspergillus mulundensis]|uniref:F-box domain-containing protein n=1 Tax=Aspergillus mulundensis TaxID=1810919 RepID=A0A3D8QVN0_9EURO|nr:hypothetical protein DSM5745_09490 [Aspergillus mulundensis]RDW65751.1 hypothetical protein DSM5745_09490 [Aspergillus mulundensis]
MESLQSMLETTSLSKGSPDHRPASPANRANICDLPPELIEEITTHLEIRHITRLRRVCRYLNEATFRSFVRGFSKLRTDLSYKSCKEFEALTQNQLLANQIKHLHITAKSIFSTETSPKTGHIRFGAGFDWLRDGDGLIIPDQEGMARWETVLKDLPNCKTITLERAFRAPQHIPCTDSDVNTDDEGDFIADVESTEEQADEYPALTHTEVHLFILAMIAKGALQPEEYELNFGRRLQGPLLGPPFEIEPAHQYDYYYHRDFRRAWRKNLSSLHFTASLKSTAAVNHLRVLVALAHRLKSLTLDFNFDSDADHSTSVVRLLSDERLASHFRLKSLELRHGKLYPGSHGQWVVHAMARHRGTLEHFGLRDMCLSDGIPKIILRDLANNVYEKLKSFRLDQVCVTYPEAPLYGRQRMGLYFRDLEQGSRVDEETKGTLEYRFHPKGGSWPHRPYGLPCPTSLVAYTGPGVSQIAKRLYDLRQYQR